MEQGSDEWFEARGGRVTASMFSAVLARKGTKKRDQYLLELVIALEGAEKFRDDPPWMQHGKENEDEGLGAYAFDQDVVIERPGFIVHPDMNYVGCSPDALVGDDGGVELKCRSSLNAHLKTVKGGMDSQYKPQVQGCLWITGREWWDFVSYYIPPNRFNGGKTDLFIQRIYPEESYIARLKSMCEEMWNDVQKLMEERRCA